MYRAVAACAGVSMLCAWTMHDKLHLHSPSLQTLQPHPSLRIVGVQKSGVHTDQEADHCCTTCTASCAQGVLRGMSSVPSELWVYEHQYKYPVNVFSPSFQYIYLLA